MSGRARGPEEHFAMNKAFPAPPPGLALVARLQSDANALSPWLTRTRREFHAHPELGWREIETTRRIAAELTTLGYRVVVGGEMLGNAARLGLSSQLIPGEGDTGCIAVFDSGRPGPTVCLRVDIDALPILEAAADHRPAAEGWASSAPSAMHACGHDGHITIGLGVARASSPCSRTQQASFSSCSSLLRKAGAARVPWSKPAGWLMSTCSLPFILALAFRPAALPSMWMGSWQRANSLSIFRAVPRMPGNRQSRAATPCSPHARRPLVFMASLSRARPASGSMWGPCMEARLLTSCLTKRFWNSKSARPKCPRCKNSTTDVAL